MPNYGAREISRSFYPDLGLGLGLRAPHFNDVLTGTPKVSWFEVISENFMGITGGTGGLPFEKLMHVREKFPIVLHGVSMNIGSTDDLNLNYLNSLKKLMHLIEPRWVSDHFCWNGVGGHNTHDLLPLPYTSETINHVCARIQFCQDYLGRRLVFENVSSYMAFKHSEMSEWSFITEIARRTDCGLLLDVNNIYVSAYNHGFDPLTYLRALPRENIAQIHLAGHSKEGHMLIDTHDHSVAPEVWQLYAEAIKLFGNISTMIERDDNIPAYSDLENEILQAEKYRTKKLENLAPNNKDSLYEYIAFT